MNLIEAYKKELLGGSEEPFIILRANDYKLGDSGEEGTKLYTADQLAAAVLKERERCAKVCESEYDNWDNERPLRICASAIRKGWRPND